MSENLESMLELFRIFSPFVLPSIIREVFTGRRPSEPAFLNSQPSENLLTRQQAADFLQISVSTLDKWTKQGLIPCRYISTEKRYLRSDLLASLKRQ